MRVWLFLLLIALVPLRTWAGDAMAIQMAAHASMDVTVGEHAPVAAHANCHDTPAESDAASASPAPDHCGTCASCQACFTVAIATPPLQIGGQAPPHHPPLAAHAQFTSAILALGHKPPIS
jgi:hypothetical protein